MVGLKVWFHTYGDALYSLRTGEPAFARTVGAELFDYLATHPEEGEIFNSAMSDFGHEWLVTDAEHAKTHGDEPARAHAGR